jgi:hypothetical protein
MQQLIDLYVKNENVKFYMEHSPDDMQGEDDLDVKVFRKLIEEAMAMGIWNGFVGLA